MGSQRGEGGRSSRKLLTICLTSTTCGNSSRLSPLEKEARLLPDFSSSPPFYTHMHAHTHTYIVYMHMHTHI